MRNYLPTQPWGVVVRRAAVFCTQRHLMLRPEGTKDSTAYPRGFVPLSGNESIETVFELVKAGHFVCPQHKIEVIHNAHVGVHRLLLRELPPLDFEALVHLQRRHRELASRILIPRDFWLLEDFNNSELNSSFGIQNFLFDNFQWSQVLSKRFVQYVDKWFPLSDHSHTTYSEYMSLLRAFAAQEEGVRALPLLPKNARLRPAFEVKFPTKAQREPMMLYRVWLQNFRKPLMLQRALVVRGGCGLLALVTRTCGVPMVMMTDPRPTAIETLRRDVSKLPSNFHHIRFQVSSLLPEGAVNRRDPESPARFDLIVYYPDQHLMQGFGDDSYAFAPGTVGFRGDLEQFFEKAGEFLTDHGVVVVCCTNLTSLAEPKKPHPIEYEVKVNRRWVILDYYDRPMPAQQPMAGDVDRTTSIPLLRDLRRQLKSELWVLHRVESLKHFAHIHKIPGAEAPSLAAAHWRFKGLATHRRRMMKQQVELMGGNWGEYKDRLLHMLQETSNDDEDEVTQAVRMALDPTYPSILAGRAKVTIEQMLEADKRFHEAVLRDFSDKSPREVCDASLAQYLARAAPALPDEK